MKIGFRSRALGRAALAILVAVLVAALGSWRFWHQDPALPDVVVAQAQQGKPACGRHSHRHG